MLGFRPTVTIAKDMMMIGRAEAGMPKVFSSNTAASDFEPSKEDYQITTIQTIYTIFTRKKK